MANGHVEIHDPFSNRSDLTTSSHSEPRSTSDMDDTVEFRLLMAYAKRRRPNRGAESPPQKGGPRSPQTSATAEKEEEEEGKTQEKKKKGGIRLSKLLSCIKPRIKEDEPVRRVANTPRAVERCLSESEDEAAEEDKLAEVASQLTEIVDEIPFTPPEIPFTPPEIESDCPTKEEDDVEKVIGLLLRDVGDRLNEQELRDANITAELFCKYSFFEKLVKAFLIRMGLLNPQPDALGPHASNKTQIAMTCEVTSRLAAVNTLPMNRMLYHGARYLQDHYSSWAQQHGGYEEAFHSDSDNEDEEEDKDEDKEDDVQ